MIDVNKIIREQIISALSGVTYEGQAVPLYHEQNPNENESLYIILSTQTEADNSNKCRFSKICTLLLDIVHRVDGCTYDAVDTVANSVLSTLQPTPQSSGVASTAQLSLSALRCISSNTITLPAATGNVMRRLLRYQIHVTEK